MSKAKNIKELIKKLRYDTSSQMSDRIFNKVLQKHEQSEQQKSVAIKPNIWRMIVGSRIGSLAAALLVISSLTTCFFLSRKVTDLKVELEKMQAKAQQDITIAESDDSAIINLYIKEHQETIARYASLNAATSQPVQMHINQDDILYYELLDGQPEYVSPGMIVRGTSYQRKISPPKAPVISNGHTLTLSDARKTAGFDLVSPLWFHPGYSLDQIRRIEDRDALQLLYSDGINTVSLFEQPLDGQRGLKRQDFREYAVYRNAEQSGGNILAWRDDELSYVLIGNTDMSQLMDMAQSISVGK